MAETNKTLFVLGSGPGNGRAVTSLFASKRYSNVALFARNAGQLEADRSAIIEAVGPQLNIKTFAVDIVDSEAFLKALEDAEEQLGKAECIFYNAARVLPSKLLSHEVKDIEYDFKINVSALYICAQRMIPQLLDMAKKEPGAMPALIVTSSVLPLHPVPQLFALSLVKAAQRNLMQSLSMTYASRGVHLGLINVGGPVSAADKTWNPTNIAAHAWEWFAQSKENPTFEVEI